ncbi:MAG: MmgE/PrpD family protein [Burkholderiales bacterium]|nr:MmgE/PrpD family protein [Burkholderiales bacterium]
MGVTAQLAETIAAIGSHDLPAEVSRRTVQAIADGIAVGLAGCAQAPIRLMAKHLRALGSKPKSSVWGLGFRASPVHAAYINAMATHVLDFEPMWSPPTHSVSPTVPVALALAEARGLNGAEVVAAVAKGMEIQGRMQYAGDQYEPEHLRFHPPGVAGVMGAVVSAAHLLKLDSMRLRHAFGIAASRCGSVLANVGTMTKSAHCGGAAAAGLDAALLAEIGFSGNVDVFEAHKGLVQTFYPDGFDAQRLLAYGRPWRVVDPGLAIKLFPSQYATHFAITAALALREQVGDPARLGEVRIISPVMQYVDRPQPATGLDGKFSLQYTAAAALLDGAVGIDTFSDERRLRADMQALLPRMRLTQDPAIAGEWRQMRVEIEADCTDGGRYSAVSHGPKGCWGQPPVSLEDHAIKLNDCLGRRLDARRSARLQAAIAALPRARKDAVARMLTIIREAQGAAASRPARRSNNVQPLRRRAASRRA